jgi:AbrB family looped-hinge helix DNA binding protein
MSETRDHASKQRTRVSEKGQTTIPKEIRESLGIEPGDVVEWSRADGEVKLEPESTPTSKGAFLPDDEEVPEDKREEIARELNDQLREKRETDWNATRGE